jgi:hypothetical protein
MATPSIDRLSADAEELDNLGDLPSGCDKIEDLAANSGG